MVVVVFFFGGVLVGLFVFFLVVCGGGGVFFFGGVLVGLFVVFLVVFGGGGGGGGYFWMDYIPKKNETIYIQVTRTADKQSMGHEKKSVYLLIPWSLSTISYCSKLCSKPNPTSQTLG